MFMARRPQEWAQIPAPRRAVAVLTGAPGVQSAARRERSARSLGAWERSTRDAPGRC